MRIDRMRLYRLELPLSAPYRLSTRAYTAFEPLAIEIQDTNGSVGWGEQHVGSGAEATAAWALAVAVAERAVGQAPDQAVEVTASMAARGPAAATAILTAIEAMRRAPVLETAREARLPLVAACDGGAPDALQEEVERLLEAGYRVLKVKVGLDVEADLARVRAIQRAAAGRATLRLDANGAFDRAQGIAFASGLDPDGVELFEQPCAEDDWDANAAVAAASTVPLMLDEPIRSTADIDRAADIPGVGFCKLKLGRFGSLAGLEAASRHVAARGMTAIVGDGLGGEIDCWMEARVAARAVHATGEFNGYLKVRPEARLLANPLPFDKGCLVLPAGYWPEIDRKRLDAATRASLHFVNPSVVRSSAPVR